MNAAIETQTVEVDGLPIRYLTAGEGPPLMLLHGAGDNALAWQWVLPDLGATHRIHAPDLPGSPDSARPTIDYSPAFFTRFVAKFLDALGIERVAFIGNSLCGLIALRLALSESKRVMALILVDSAGLGRAVNPAFTSVNVPGLGEAAMPIWRTIYFASRRTQVPAPPAEFEAVWTVGERLGQAEPGSLDFFLTERYCLYSARGGRLYRTRIFHRPWSLCTARLLSFRSTMIESQGLPSPSSEPLLHQQGEPLRVRVWPQVRVW